MGIVEDFYRDIAQRAPDANGLAYWNDRFAAGASAPQVEAEFRSAVDGVHAREAATGGGSTTVLGKDISGLRWDDLAQEVHEGKLRSNPDSKNMESAYTYSSILGGEVQGYVDTTQSNRNWKGNSREGGVDVYDWQSLSSINLKDEDAPEGYMTKLYRTDDGGIGVDYYEQQNGFVRDMILFAATAMGMYGAVTALGAAAGSAGGAGAVTSGASSTVGSAAAGAGELTLTEAMTTFAPEFGTEVAAAGMSEAGFATGFSEVATQTGFQATQLTAPWEQVATNTLGSGMNGIETVDGLLKVGTMTPDGLSVGGLTLTPSGEVIAAGSSFSSQVAAAQPWVNPAATTITDVVVNSAGSVSSLVAGTDAWSTYAASQGTVIPEGNWWDSLVSAPGSALTDIAKDVATGLVTGAVIDKVLTPGGIPGGAGGTGGVNITIPKPDPSAAALQPSASQRAGVKFGRTKSKRQLKGKFSGTGISL